MSSVEENILPDKWKLVRLDEIGNFIRGVSYKKPQLLESHQEGCITLLRANNIQNGLFLENCQYLPNGFVKNEKLTKKGDILIAMSSGSKNLVGKNVFLPALTNYSFGAFCSVYRLNEVEQSSYVSLFFQSHHYKEIISNLFRGAGINNLRSSDLEEVYIPIPPLEEQKRIVDKIDTLFAKIDKAISLTEESLKQAKDLLPSVLKEVFEKEKIKIGDVSLSTVVDILSGVSLPKLFKGVSKRDGDIPYYKVAQMNNDTYTMKGALLKFSATEAEQYKIKLFPKGTVLLPKRGGAILTNKKRVLTEVASYDSNIMGLKAKNNFVSDEYLFAVLKNIDLSDYIDESTIPQINNKHIDRMRIVLTDLERQKEIVAISDTVGKSYKQTQSKLEKQLSYLKQLKSSILSKAFKGEL